MIVIEFTCLASGLDATMNIDGTLGHDNMLVKSTQTGDHLEHLKVTLAIL